jgi:L-threonylcarbamoyladenylate synthase
MRTIHINDQGAITQAADVLRGGGIVIAPTDTLYGFSAAMSSREGHDRVAKLKGSAGERSFIYLASSVEMVDERIESWGCTSEDKMRGIWPAPLTAIFRKSDGCSEWAGDTVAFRVPALELLLSIIKALREPILSTSVNRTGEPPLVGIHDIVDRFGGGVDLVVTGDECTQASASTVVDFTGTKPTVVRRGSYAWA